MSKKDRLKKEKEKQILAQKKQEMSDIEEKENFKESKALKKYKKTVTEPKFYLAAKLLMLVPFGWSAFYGLVLSGAILMNLANKYDFTEFSTKTAVLILGGILVTALSLVLHFCKKYIGGFAFSLAGTLLYIKGANEFILPIDNYLETNIVENMDKYVRLWKIRCYPMWAVVGVSAVILTVTLVRKHIAKKKQREKFDNTPVKSIVSD